MIGVNQYSSMSPSIWSRADQMNMSSILSSAVCLVMKPALYVNLTLPVPYHAMRTASPVMAQVPTSVSPVIQVHTGPIPMILNPAARAMKAYMVNHMTAVMCATMPLVNTVWDPILTTVWSAQKTMSLSTLKMRMLTSASTASTTTSSSLYVVLVTSLDFVYPTLSHLSSTKTPYVHARLVNGFMMEDVYVVLKGVQNANNLQFTVVRSVFLVSGATSTMVVSASKSAQLDSTLIPGLRLLHALSMIHHLSIPLP